MDEGTTKLSSSIQLWELPETLSEKVFDRQATEVVLAGLVPKGELAVSFSFIDQILNHIFSR